MSETSPVPFRSIACTATRDVPCDATVVRVSVSVKDDKFAQADRRGRELMRRVQDVVEALPANELAFVRETGYAEAPPSTRQEYRYERTEKIPDGFEFSWSAVLTFDRADRFGEIYQRFAEIGGEGFSITADFGIRSVTKQAVEAELFDEILARVVATVRGEMRALSLETDRLRLLGYGQPEGTSDRYRGRPMPMMGLAAMDDAAPEPVRVYAGTFTVSRTAEFNFAYDGPANFMTIAASASKKRA